jgi:4-carboxymuconolactone decarboxylase
MEKPVQGMTLQELRDELDRTRPAWEGEVGDLEGVLTDTQRPALGEEARRHQVVANELLRRPTTADLQREFGKDTATSPGAGSSGRQVDAAGLHDERTSRLVKLGTAVGALSEGAVRSSARKALAAGATFEEVQQVVLLALTTRGFPATVAAWGWVQEVLEQD